MKYRSTHTVAVVSCGREQSIAMQMQQDKYCAVCKVASCSDLHLHLHHALLMIVVDCYACFNAVLNSLLMWCIACYNVGLCLLLHF